jgi:hypothetical protein
VLVGSADVGRDDPQYRPVRKLPPDVVGVDTWPITQLERREVDVLNLDLAGPDVGNTSVLSHR